jgi:SAM-dependent methyltransferase
MDWADWLERWDRQQARYLVDREERFAAMLDVLDVCLGREFVALDLACGPGSISRRLIERFPSSRTIAVDTDPVLLAIGQGALGDMDGRIAWLKEDLTDPRWIDRVAEGLGGRPLNAVLSSTALHWLAGDVLARVYQQAAGLMPQGAVLMNADHMQFGPHQPMLRELASELKSRSEAAAMAANPGEDWAAWWAALEREPELAELFAERERRFAWRDRQWIRPSYEFQVGALLEAGFREVGTIWQRRDNRVLLAIK